MTHVIPTTASEAKTRSEIVRELDKWNKDTKAEEGGAIGDYDFITPQKVGGNAAAVRFILRGQTISVECDSQPTYRHNIRAVFYAIQSMRMNEKRGIADTIRKAYLMIEAPKEMRNPYEVLGVLSDTPIDDIEAMYKVKAKRLHSDVGGDDEQMKELNIAWETIQEQS